MDNDTKKILLLIARALQLSAISQLANYHNSGPMQDALAKDVLVTRDLLAKINNEENNNA